MKSTRVTEDADGPISPLPESVQCFPTLLMLPDPPHRFSVVVLCISRHVVGLHDVAIVEKSQNSNSCHPDPVLRTGMILDVIN